MKVRWTDTALRHLSAIHDYITQDSPVYARSMVDRPTARSRQIGDFPLSGRVVPESEAEDIREVMESSYGIIYRVRSEQVDVLAVVHGARQLPPRR